MACPICKNTNINNFFSLKDYEYNINSITEYSICELCAIIYRNTDIKEEDEKLLYSKKIYKPVKGGLIYDYFKKINAYYEKYNILKYLSKDNPYKIKTILDIACGKGYLLEEFAKNKKNACFGIDINAKNKKSNIEFINSSYKNLNIIQNINADTIIINNFIEHIEDLKDLYKILGIMKKNSNMVIITPDTASKARKIFGNCWSGYHAPRHKILFNKNNILKVFTDIKDINIQIYKLYDPFTNIISLSNLTKELKNKFSLKVLLKLIISPLLLFIDIINKNRILVIITKSK